MLISEQAKEAIKELREIYTDEYFASGDKPDMILLRIIEAFELIEQRISNIECFIKHNLKG